MARAAVVFVLLASVLAGCVGEPRGGVRDAFDASVPHCVGECGRVVDGSDARAWQPFLAVDPNEPDHVVIAHGALPDVADADFSMATMLFSVSQDGGETWKTGPGASGLGGRLPRGSQADYDPVLAFLPDGVLVVSAVASEFVTLPEGGLRSAQSIYTSRSVDGGHTWPDTRVIDQGAGGTIGGPADAFLQGGWVGLPGLASGPDGELLLFWSKGYGSPESALLAFASSIDGGLTWTAPGVVGRGYDAQPVIGLDGGWRVSYVTMLDDDLHFAQSDDQGRSWDSRVIGECSLKPAMRTQLLGSGQERLLLACPTGGNRGDQVEFSWSDDGGASWAPRVVLHQIEGGGGPMPHVAAGPRDSAWVTFFDIGDSRDGAQELEYRIVNVQVDGSQTLVLDRFPASTSQLGRSMALGATPDGTAIAAWVTLQDGEYDLASARTTLEMS